MRIVKQLIAHKILVTVGPLMAGVVLGGTMLLIVLTVAVGARPDALPGLCAADGNLDRILATIRQIESGNNYRAQAVGATASGAYQIVNGTWNGYGGYTAARDAPPAVQDAKAAELVKAILDTYHDISYVPIGWYLPSALDNADQWDVVPMPEAGNQLTIRGYQTRWLAEYQRQTADGQIAAGSICAAFAPVGNYGTLTAGIADCGTLGWGGYPNGHIPTAAMRYSPASNYMHPAASLAYGNLYAAAQGAGLDLRGNGYRPAYAGEHTAGTSCHGIGLAIDITALVDGDHPAGPDAKPTGAFFAPEFTWMCANANRYGYAIPAYALPKGMRCGVTIGNGHGGWRGDRCCYLEPWHWEAVGTALTDPDFDASTRRRRLRRRLQRGRTNAPLSRSPPSFGRHPLPESRTHRSRPGDRRRLRSTRSATRAASPPPAAVHGLYM